MDMKADLTCKIGSMTWKNPVCAASGTFGWGLQMPDLCPASVFGAVMLKGLSMEPKDGNPPPRIVETPSGIINSIGLQNPGIKVFTRDIAPMLPGLKTVVIANILGETVDEYVQLALRMDAIDAVDAVEVNISCPNIHSGGLAFASDPAAGAGVVKAVRGATSKPVIVKLPPGPVEPPVMARSCADAGADAVSLVNTMRAMVIDTNACRPVLRRNIGGLSGPAIRPVALRMVWETAAAVDIPVIGGGGIMTADDAAQFLLAGASAVSMGTAVLIDPSGISRVIRETGEWMDKSGFADLAAVHDAFRPWEQS